MQYQLTCTNLLVAFRAYTSVGTKKIRYTKCVFRNTIYRQITKNYRGFIFNTKVKLYLIDFIDFNQTFKYLRSDLPCQSTCTNGQAIYCLSFTSIQTKQLSIHFKQLIHYENITNKYRYLEACLTRHQWNYPCSREKRYG